MASEPYTKKKGEKPVAELIGSLVPKSHVVASANHRVV
jgi:hypothetical protein